MRKIIFFLVCLALGYSHAIAQKCLTEVLHEEAIQKDSSYLVKRARIQKQISEFETQNGNSNKTTANVRIIPVVFHIIHEGKEENISKAQITDQIRILNEDYRRLNKDASNTPGPFKPVAADCNIEFRLAQKDPNGDCTQGIVRIFSPLTNNARDNIKSLSYWPSSGYLNIWVVKSIKSNSNGTVLGYAQLPGGAASTDGVVLRSDVIGSIGTATTSFGKNEAGRSATHEIGHWLDLRHTWGDDNGTCDGTDGVTDTPNQADFSEGCLSFPKTDACTSGGNGIMFMNYMDYTNGKCMNLFTAGQKVRIDATFNASRATLITPQNLSNTGTDGTTATLCAPLPWFSPSQTMICPNNSISFIDESYNGTPTKWTWSFPGGTPATSNLQDPVIFYDTPGKYDVTLTAGNTAGSNTLTRTALITISSPTANYKAPYTDHFETASFPGTEWRIINEDNGNTWEKSTSATTTKDGRIGIENFQANIPTLKDIIISPSIDLSGIKSPTLTFNLAYAQTAGTNTDKLTIWLSKDCGQSWGAPGSEIAVLRSGTTLTSAGIIPSRFAPNPKQWNKKEYSLAPRLATGSRNNIRLKFEFENGGGNNIFIDDISVGEPTTFDQKGVKMDLAFFPNPSPKEAYLAFNLFQETMVSINVYDAFGRELPGYAQQKLPPGEQVYKIGDFENNGMYFVQVTIGEEVYLKKLVIY